MMKVKRNSIILIKVHVLNANLHNDETVMLSFYVKISDINYAFFYRTIQMIPHCIRHVSHSSTSCYTLQIVSN
jgi:hypothetical protein